MGLPIRSALLQNDGFWRVTVAYVSELNTSAHGSTARPIEGAQSSLFGMAIRDAFFPVSVFFSIYYVGVAIAQLMNQEGLALLVLPGLALVISALFLIQGFRWRRQPPRTDITIGWFVLLLSFSNTVALNIHGQADAFFGQLIVQIGLGLVGVSWRAFYVLSLVIAFPVFSAIWFGPGVDMSGSPTLLFGGAFMLSYVLQILSIRYRERLAQAQAESDIQRRAAETNLLRFQEESSRREALQEKLAHSDRLESLGILAGGVAHDFNNLLAVIIGRASALQVQPMPKDLHEGVGAVLEAAERAALLSRELLAYAGRSAQVTEPVDLNREAAAVSRLAQSTLPAGVELAVAQSTDDEVVLADRGQVQQILLNLIMNAADSMAGRGGTVEVETGRVELTEERATELEPPQRRTGGEYCFVQVKDQGTGISPEIRKHIFDPFFSTKPEGRGLGLAAALGIARVRGGGFEVESESGSGSCFTLYLPASSASVQPLEAVPRRHRLQEVPRVLVIDDRAEVRDMVLTVLERCGYDGVGVDGGRAAVSLLAASPGDYSLAIVDMSMPDMDGEATFRALRAIRGDLPVLLSSGFDAHETAARLAHIEGVDFLPKPYRLAELQNRIEALVSHPA